MLAYVQMQTRVTNVPRAGRPTASPPAGASRENAKTNRRMHRSAS